MEATMQEILMRCDMPLKKRGELVPCGEEVTNAEPTLFSLGTSAYKAELCDVHREKLEDSLASFIQIAEQVRVNPSQVRRAVKGKKGTFTTKDVRKWLEEQGREVAPSGRLPNELIEEYRTAHSGGN
jgi:hypothetical protein